MARRYIIRRRGPRNRRGGGGYRVVAAAAATVNAVRFDGASVWLNKAAAPTGVTDSANGTLSFGVRFEAGDASAQTILCVGTFSTVESDLGLLVERTAANLIRAVGYTAAGVKIFDCISTGTTVTADSTAHHILIQWNDTACTITIDGTDATANTPGTSGSVDLTNVWQIGRHDNSAARNYLNASLGEIWFDISSDIGSNAFYDSGNSLFRALGDLGTDYTLFLSGAAAAFGTNNGTGGDFTTNGPLADATNFGTPASALVNAAHFSKTGGDHLETTVTTLGGSVNHGCLSVWFRFRGGDATEEKIFETSNSGRVQVFRFTDNLIYCRLGNGTTELRVRTTAVTGSAWHHLAVSWRNETSTGGAAVGQAYLDGADVTVGVTNTIGTDTFNLDIHAGVGSDTFTAKLDGDLAELWFTDEGVDLSTAISKFYSGGQPVDLGSDGSTPTGNQPILYLKNPANSLETNLGTHADLMVNGSLEPTDGPEAYA